MDPVRSTASEAHAAARADRPFARGRRASGEHRPRRRLLARVAAAGLGAALCVVAACSGGGGGGGSPHLSVEADASTSVRFDDAYTWTAHPKHAHGEVTYALVAAPVGMTVSPEGLVSWSPTQDDLGTHAVQLDVSDARTTVSVAWTVRVHQGLLLGVTLSQRGHTTHSTEQDYVDFFAGHADYGAVIGFHGRWRDDVADDGEVPELFQFATLVAQQDDFAAALGVGWADGAGEPDLASESDPDDDSWTNAETRAEFQAMVTALAGQAHPAYLFLGNETNSYWLTHSDLEWAAWISEYEACYDAVKAVSPETLVGTNFQFEHMAGFGANTGWTDPEHFDLLDDFTTSGRLDVLSFTTYPFLEFDDPADIPDDVYAPIAAHWSGKLLFTELAWKAFPSFAYPGSQAQQTAFVTRFFELVADLDVEYATWIFLHDWDGQAAEPVVAWTGFRNNDASVVRPSDAAWREAVALRQR
ncbi:MAG: hypothetical protein H6825_03515 [Planctomycetes bacterium]|nr:hypothetical protein [Planctomycetota bacterium]